VSFEPEGTQSHLPAGTNEAPCSKLQGILAKANKRFRIMGLFSREQLDPYQRSFLRHMLRGVKG